MRLLSALLLIAGTAFAQSTGEKMCAVDGSVVNSVTGVAIPRAYVKVTIGEDSVVSESDAAGKWSVEHLTCTPAAVPLKIDANRIGFLQSAQKPRQPVVLSPDNPLHDVRLELIPQSLITGAILDDRGDPLQGANVTLLTSRVSNGIRGLRAAQSTNTNDLGEYRFAGLSAGKYLICADGGAADKALSYGAKAFGEKCYPGPPDAGSAIAMNVAAGYEGRVDFTLTPLSGVQVKGVVSGVPKNADIFVALNPWGLRNQGMSLYAQVRRDGSFIFKSVPSGSHLLTVGFSDARQQAQMMRIDVGASDLELQVSLYPPANVTGVVKLISTSGKKTGKPEYRVLLTSDDSFVSTGGDDWDETRTSFKLDVIPGRYRLELSAPSPLYMKSATLDDHDIAGSIVTIGQGGGKIDIVAADDSGSVEGDVSSDERLAPAWILLQKDGMPSRNARADAKGHFKIDAVPPGDYKIYAWDDIVNVEYANPDWMQHNGKPVAVTVGPGQTAQVKLARQIAPEE